MAQDAGYPTLANMVLMGKMMKETGLGADCLEAALKKVVSAKRAELLEVNLKALKSGYDYEG